METNIVSIVIVGSPGDGKSCFLMIIAFYLARIKRKKVLVIRRLVELNLKNVVLIEGKVDEKEAPIVLVDGVNPAEVDDTKNDSRIVVLPAWRDANLLQYTKLTNWVVDSGLRKIKRQKTPVAKLVKEQYFYSGGSLREFCKNGARLKSVLLCRGK
ncbi:P-loop containing nucleoside triphosphate hydrolase [Plasmopara halstedii]|uniref:p-loop containing nucleoside triphosphate hydrolase n=1 Tax=Plasmopara halstedii TaxID=4781 RepID=A0A0P1AG19_PLAHL|nr:P-loop containing nucleoside triphosphate hydrolase [Plasmopara halstedii]CEG39561.1 P-loop containing nucleoside triphosphate hydrolase [Plasmopara halstedii]|eukprot:XP_024575930.1 P-loop containing nucleoside triphosphate hydrolase [Plasmopara halstedii]